MQTDNPECYVILIKPHEIRDQYRWGDVVFWTREAADTFITSLLKFHPGAEFEYSVTRMVPAHSIEWRQNPTAASLAEVSS